MPVLKIHISTELEPEKRQALAVEARHTLVEGLGLAPEFGKVILYATDPQCRSVHSSRDPNFVLAEVLMFRGRDDGLKRGLYQRLNEVISRHTGVGGGNIFINIIESPREDWGIRGGHSANSVDLGY